MSLSEIFDCVWASFSGTLLALGGAGAIILKFSDRIAKLWTERYMAGLKEAHERRMAEEKAQYERDLEEFRATLRKQSHEAETRFSSFHAKRVEVIAEIFGKLHAFSKSAEDHLIGKQVDPDKLQNFSNTRVAFVEAFEKSEIYLPKTLCDDLSEFAQKLTFHSNEKGILDEATKHSDIPQNQIEEVGASVRSRYSFVTETVPKLKDQLTLAIRELL